MNRAAAAILAALAALPALFLTSATEFPLLQTPEISTAPAIFANSTSLLTIYYASGSSSFVMGTGSYEVGRATFDRSTGALVATSNLTAIDAFAMGYVEVDKKRNRVGKCEFASTPAKNIRILLSHSTSKQSSNRPKQPPPPTKTKTKFLVNRQSTRVMWAYTQPPSIRPR